MTIKVSNLEDCLEELTTEELALCVGGGMTTEKTASVVVLLGGNGGVAAIEHSLSRSWSM
jgi:hypothetical protein